MKILVKQVKDPFCFWGVVVKGSTNSEFQILQDDIESYYGNPGSLNYPIREPKAGMKCVVKLDTGLWKRAIIKNLISTCPDYCALCVIVDEGTSETVSVNKIFQSFKWVWKVPCQVLKFGLYGVTPCRLKANYYMNEASLRPSIDWDSSATVFFEGLLSKGDYLAEVEVIEKGFDEIHWVKMKLCNTEILVNELLISEKYCFEKAFDEDYNGDDESIGSEASMMKGIRLLMRKEHRSALEVSSHPASVRYVSNEIVDPRNFGTHKGSADNGNQNEDEVLNDTMCREDNVSIKSIDTSQTSKLDDTIKSVKSTKSTRKETKTCTQHFRNLCLIEGAEIPNSYSIFCQTPFTEDMIRGMESMKLRRPTVVQGHCWPAVWKGRDVVAVSATKTGKTLCYVAPLLTMLFKELGNAISADYFPSSIRSNKTVNTAVAVRYVILCSSRRNIQNVSDVIRNFLRFRGGRNIMDTVISVSERSAVNDELAVDLLNNCRIIVCSPYSFIEICKQNLIPLFKLKHLVFDDCDILMEDFTCEVKDIMKMVFESLKDEDLPKIDKKRPQILLFGNILTDGVKSFKEFCMNKNTITYIEDPMQAIIYKPVKQQVVVCEEYGKYETLIEMVSDIDKNTTKHVVVFVGSSDTSSTVYTALSNACVVEVYEVNEYFQPSIDFDESPAVMVVTDDDINLLQGFQIEHGIHFEYPTSLNSLALRISMISNNLENSMSYFMFTPSDDSKAAELVELFNRMGQPIPKSLMQISFKPVANTAPSVTSSNNNVVKQRLCAYMMTFGFCRNKNKCKLRHEIDPSLDKPNNNKRYVKVPLNGHVKVRITNVNHASHYFARLVKHADVDRNKTDFSGDYEELVKNLECYFKNNKEPVKAPQKGDLVGIDRNGKLYRAVILGPEVKGKPEWYKSSTYSICKYKVFLVDSGEQYTIYRTSIYQLNDEKLQKTPYQAIEVRALGLKPADKNDEWDMKANELIHSQIYDKDLEGNIKYVIGHTLWLEPCVVRSKVYKTNLFVEDCNVSKLLFRNRFAVVNEGDSTWLSATCIKSKSKEKNKSINYNEVSAKLESVMNASGKSTRTTITDVVEASTPAEETPQPFRSRLSSEISISTINKSDDTIKLLNEQTFSDSFDSTLVGSEKSGKPTSLDVSDATTNVPNLSVEDSDDDDENKENDPVRVTNLQLVPRNDSKVDVIELILSENLGVLLPLCALVDHSNNNQDRLATCRKIYMLCAELSYDVSDRDVRALYSLLLKLNTDTEKLIVMGSFLKLLYFTLPVWDHISAPHIMASLLSYQTEPPSLKLVLATLNFVHFFLENCDNYKLYKLELTDVTEMLVEFIKYFVSKYPPEETNEEISRIVMLSFRLIFNVMKISRSLIKSARNKGVMELITNLVGRNFGVKELNSIFDEILSIIYEEEKLQKELEEKKSRPKPSAHDVFGYERFDHLDTSDTEDSTASFQLDYQTIPANFDAMQENHTDVEDLVEDLDQFEEF